MSCSLVDELPLVQVRLMLTATTTCFASQSEAEPPAVRRRMLRGRESVLQGGGAPLHPPWPAFGGVHIVVYMV